MPLSSVILLVELVGIEVLRRNKESAITEQPLKEGMVEGKDVVELILSVKIGHGEEIIDVLDALALACMKGGVLMM